MTIRVYKLDKRIVEYRTGHWKELYLDPDGNLVNRSYPGIERVRHCTLCGEICRVGSRVVTKTMGGRGKMSKMYHFKCAKKLNIF